MEDLYRATIESMKETIDEMKPSTLQETKLRLDKYFRVLEFMMDLNDEEYEQEEAEEDMDKEEEEKPELEEQTEDSLETAEKIPDNAYPLDRKLSGGYLITGNVEDNIFVPETVIRELDARNGDYMTAEVIRTNSYGYNTYHYEIVERAGDDTEDKREEFKYGIVEYDESTSRFIVYNDINHETLKINDEQTMFVADERDESNFSLVDGDIVDIAWYKGGFNETSRVVWKYSTDEVPKEKTESKKMNSYSKPKEKSEKEEVEQTLEGKRICLIGLEPYWDKYKKLVEERGGELETVESERHKVSMNAAIRKSDLVVVGISHTSHDASTYASSRAKTHDVPFESISGYGGESFIRTVEERIQLEEAKKRIPDYMIRKKD